MRRVLIEWNEGKHTVSDPNEIEYMIVDSDIIRNYSDQFYKLIKDMYFTQLSLRKSNDHLPIEGIKASS